MGIESSKATFWDELKPGPFDVPGIKVARPGTSSG
jgi:hypothetical protein